MSGTEFIMAMTVICSGIGLVFFFAVPARRALLRKIEGSAAGHDSMLAGEVEQLRDRMGELEERLDFAERLLARQREGAELPPGGFR
jgi:hypothetical protein